MAPVRIEVGIEHGDSHADAAWVGHVAGQDRHEIVRRDAWRPRAVDRGHHGFVEDVDVQVDPETFVQPLARGLQ